MAEKSTFKKKIPSIIPSVIPKGPKSLAEPEKELRFTRASQAGAFYALSVIFFSLTMAIFILSTQNWGMTGPKLAEWFWVWLCIPGITLTFIFMRLGLRCTRHAYIILSPLGVEIFPFFHAQKNLQLVYWSEITDVDVDTDKLTLHFTEEKKSGIVASLAPIPRKRRRLLKKAILGVMENRASA